MAHNKQHGSPRERRMAVHVDDPAMLPEETPEERSERINRNWQELKKARILALRQGNTSGVTILDEELEAGRGTDFPAEADLSASADSDLESDDDSDLGPLINPKVIKTAQQATVRKSEPSMSLIEQEAAERGWEAARQEYIKQHGVLTPGMTQAEAISKATGRRDPTETREAAEAQHAVETGELTYGDSPLYNIAKPAAAIAGFSAGGPLGAIGAEALVRATAIGYNLDKALDKGMDPDQAADIFVKEMSKGTAVDALFNFGAPVIGRVIAKIPGLNRITANLHAALERRLGGPAPRPGTRETRIENLKELAGSPERAEAVEQLAKRVEGDFVPTPGQVTGKTGTAESYVRTAFPGQFKEQETALTAAAGKMRGELLETPSQPGQQALGQQVSRLIDSTVKATKDRLRPVFQEADNAKVIVDFNNVQAIARQALAKDAAGIGKGKLTAEGRAHLQSIVDSVDTQPWRSAEPALDFLSVQKSVARSLDQEGKSTPYFKTIVDDMIRVASESFDDAARRMGRGDLVKKLLSARNDYRVMMESAYDGAIKQALRKGAHAPEDIGRYLWQEGKVTRVNELDDLLGLALKEGTASAGALSKMRRNVARGFLQEAVRDVPTAAKWSESLADPKRRATWELLTKGPEGQALKHGMEVLQQAAQIATKNAADVPPSLFKMMISRATTGGLGISLVTGGLSPWLIGAGLGIDGTMRLMTTAYVHGDKGTINLVAKILRANSTGTAASVQALRALLPQLEDAAKKYDITDLFTKNEANQQPETEQSPQSVIDATPPVNPNLSRPRTPASGGVRG